MRRLWISAVVIALDQLSKVLVVQRMALHESTPVLGDLVRLTYIQNPGGVFGLRLGGQALHLVFAAVALCLIAALLYRTPPEDRVGGTGLALVLGGAIGNVIDRLHTGAVIDFLDVGLGELRWWVFNVADMSVTTGAGLLILAYGILQKNGGVAAIDTTADTAAGAPEETDREAGDRAGA